MILPARQYKHVAQASESVAQASEPLAARRLRKHPPRRASSGFTLVELLVVVLIIGILASMVLGALYASQEKSKGRFTRATISKLHNQIVQRWDSYRTRRVQLQPAYSNPSQTNAAQMAQWQLRAKWELMRMELPDHYGDLKSFTPQYSTPSALWSAYYAMVNWNGNPDPTQNNVSAEMLYLVITVGMNPDDELQFMEREVGDTDGDGMFEFLDGWGRPIRFCRWAPGFVSELQPPDVVRSPDPFDPLGLNRSGSQNPYAMAKPTGNPPVWGFALQPLIFSAGPDGSYGIWQGMAPTNNPFSYANGKWIGSTSLQALDEGGGPLDNIHNHFLGGR